MNGESRHSSVGKAYEIDQRAIKIFSTRIPDNWLPRKQDPDFFVDFLVEIVEHGEPTGLHFAAQIKGHEDTTNGGKPLSYLQPTNSTDVFTNNTLAYQTGPFGTFYQPNSSPLLHMGSTTADQVGLYHYTVQTNLAWNYTLIENTEVPEGNNTVSIGYHYVATDAYGNPLDSNLDGIPDYLEDANGNGLVDSGEMAWDVFGDFGLKVLITRPRNSSNLP